jgi:hypothetical protein
VFSGTFGFGGFQLSPIWRVASGAPFNITIGGVDRNLDDVSNDRPNHSFSLPPIGQSGNLPRNAGRGPGLFMLDLNVSKDIQITKRVHLRPSVEFDNVLNKTVFSFGSEFIDASQMPKRTMRPREIRIGIKISHG